MKLKCGAHNRRIVAFSDGTVIHRTGDGSSCSTYFAHGITAYKPDSNGQRYFVDEHWPVMNLFDYPAECVYCYMDKSEVALYSGADKIAVCSRRMGTQPHVFG